MSGARSGALSSRPTRTEFGSSPRRPAPSASSSARSVPTASEEALVRELLEADASELLRLRHKGVDLASRGIRNGVAFRGSPPPLIDHGPYNWGTIDFSPKVRVPFGTTGHLGSYQTTYAGDFQSGDNAAFEKLLKQQLSGQRAQCPTVGRLRLRGRRPRQKSPSEVTTPGPASGEPHTLLSLGGLGGSEGEPYAIGNVLRRRHRQQSNRPPPPPRPPGSPRPRTPPQQRRAPFVPCHGGSPIAHTFMAPSPPEEPTRRRGVRRTKLPGRPEGADLQLALHAWGSPAVLAADAAAPDGGCGATCTDGIHPRLRVGVAEKPQVRYAGAIERMQRAAQVRAAEELAAYDAARRQACARGPARNQPAPA
eukprot:TRINITY_DN60230_c0_g1_i1.p1 TRINITY_DN60230_c0_g1~~TRINITY_DN60230_c0_g1_i1.p1  ORF type:complete len:391 (+),score=63.42 TRINITY_DN60230_c0_g1_i1:76-1173(+)